MWRITPSRSITKVTRRLTPSAPGEVAQDGEGEPEFTGVGPGREGGVDAHAQHLGVGRLELRQEFLEAAQLLRSAPSEREHVERHHHVLVLAELRERVLLPRPVAQDEVRRRVPHAQGPRFNGHSTLPPLRGARARRAGVGPC